MGKTTRHEPFEIVLKITTKFARENCMGELFQIDINLEQLHKQRYKRMKLRGGLRG